MRQKKKLFEHEREQERFSAPKLDGQKRARDRPNTLFMQKTDEIPVKKNGESKLLNGKTDIEHFYKTLYSTTAKVPNGAFDSFVSHLQIPTISNQERESLGGELTLKECLETLKAFSNEK